MHRKPKIDLTLTADDMAALELLAEQAGVTRQTWVRLHILPVLRKAMASQTQVDSASLPTHA